MSGIDNNWSCYHGFLGYNKDHPNYKFVMTPETYGTITRWHCVVCGRKIWHCSKLARTWQYEGYV